jgi:hypothetical protein
MRNNSQSVAQPKIKQIDHDDLQALYDSASPPRATGGTTVRSRKAKERSGVKSTDGRRHKTKGRDKQFNTNLTPDMFERMADMCERFDLTKAEFTELAFRAAMTLLKSGGLGALQDAGGEGDAE